MPSIASSNVRKRLPKWMNGVSNSFLGLALGILTAFASYFTLNPNLYFTIIIGSIATGIVLLAQILSGIRKIVPTTLPLTTSAQERRSIGELSLFLYLNTTAVNNLFNQIAPRLRLSEMRQERGIEDRYGLTIPSVGGVSYGVAESQRVTQAFRQEETPEMKLSIIMDFLEDRKQLSRDLEKFAYDEEGKKSVEVAVAKLETRLSDSKVSITAEERRDLVASPLKPLVQKKIGDIRSARGFVIVSGEFDVVKYTDKSWTIALRHPVNSFLDKEPFYRITANGSSEGEELTRIGKDHLNADKARATVFGIVKEFNETETYNELNINPIAVFV